MMTMSMTLQAPVAAPKKPAGISNRLGSAFCEIVEHFNAWRPPLPEIEVTVGRSFHPMSQVCLTTIKYDEEMPTAVADRLFSLVHGRHKDLELKLAFSPTYRTGAICLLRLIGDRKSKMRKIV
jgi:hypothetical protein